MKTITTRQVVDEVARLCMEANRYLPKDVRAACEKGHAEETGAAKEIFRQLLENADLAADTGLPLCQDTGLAVFFVDLGDEVRIEGGNLHAAIDEGVRKGYREGYLRKSSCDPFTRANTGDNTPAIVHFDLVPGDGLTIRFMAKGGGAENMSRVTMLAPAQGWEGIKKFVVNRVAEAGPNPCPPTIIGIGIGGTFDYAPILAKKALLRRLDDTHPDPKVAAMEAELLAEINGLGIGPMGLGGATTSLGVKINVAPCHLASLPLAVNVQCHSSRHMEVTL
ncbi:MAG: fumarate hydratase [Desulfovibrionaceae bacterium]|jgi:fumarate hydratase subunit alpha|nr:fumarate hydratase [Desulfovibrionaceae bacterium]